MARTTCPTQSTPARVERANWKREHAASTSSATNRRNTVPVAMPWTPPSRFESSHGGGHERPENIQNGSACEIFDSLREEQLQTLSESLGIQLQSLGNEIEDLSKDLLNTLVAACVSIPPMLTHPEVPTVLLSTPDGLWTLGPVARDFGLLSHNAPAPRQQSSVVGWNGISETSHKLCKSNPSTTPLAKSSARCANSVSSSN